MKHRSIWVLLGCIVGLFTAGFGAQEIVTYGVNTSQWNLKLRTTSTRGSCKSGVDACLQAVDKILHVQHTSKFYLNLLGDGQAVANEVTQFSLKSVQHPGLYEVGIDDFYTSFRKWCKTYGVARCEQQLTDIIRGVKSHNPKLKFGITLYDDKLKLILKDPQISSALRAQFDTIHFYLHFRKNEVNLASYIAAIKKGFPNAKIILGLYAYDRVDYLPCQQGGKVHCTPATDKSWFVSALKAGLALSKAGQIAGIEFYPGNFGTEAYWRGWKNKKVCVPGRKTQCIQNTVSIRSSVGTIMSASH